MLEVKIDTLSLRISLSNVEYRNILYVHYSDPDIFIVVASVHARTESCYSGCRHVTVCVVLDYHVFSLFHCNVEDNGPHSRTFSEVSSEMFLTGFGKTT